MPMFKDLLKYSRSVNYYGNLKEETEIHSTQFELKLANAEPKYEYRTKELNLLEMSKAVLSLSS